MNRSIVIIAAVIILGICLLSGGCSTFVGDQSMKAWKDLLSLAPKEEPVSEQDTRLEDLLAESTSASQQEVGESLIMALYYADSAGNSLVSEDRAIKKTEGIARETINELLKGPVNTDCKTVFPEGTRLLDINIKPDGMCIVDLSGEARQVKTAQEEKFLVYAITNTLGAFPTVKSVSFMIEGQACDSIAGYMDLSSPIKPDYTI